MVGRDSLLWQYLSTHQQELIEDGERLFAQAEAIRDEMLSVMERALSECKVRQRG